MDIDRTLSAEEIVRGRIEAIKARCEAATPGPWRAIERGNSVISHAVVTVAYDSRPQQNVCAGISPKTGNAAFIAHASEDIPYLLQLVEAQAAEIAELRGRVTELEGELEESETGRQAADNTNSWNASRADDAERMLFALAQKYETAVEDITSLLHDCTCEHRHEYCDGFGSDDCTGHYPGDCSGARWRGICGREENR